jgi:serine/threonine protein kinase
MQCSTCGAVNPPGATRCTACGSLLQVPPAQTFALPPGTSLHGGDFVVERVLGQGGFGITYRGTYVPQQAPVAIKELFPEGATRQGLTIVPGPKMSPAEFQQACTRFLDEAQALARFAQPNIVRVYTAFQEHNTVYMAMELVDGQSLYDLVQRRGALPELDAVRYIVDVAKALHEVHAKGILHRDLKPDNIMLTTGGRIVLLDFGSAREFAMGHTRLMTQIVSPGYAPLEQYAKQGRYGPGTDIYALGATMYHLLCGVIPVGSPDRATGVLLSAPHAINGNVSVPTSDAVMQAMAIRAVDRPQSALAFASLLTNASPPLVPIPVAARSPWSEALQQLRAALAATLDNRIAGLLNQWPQLQQLLMPGEQQSLADHHARRQALARMRQALRDANEQAVLTMSADAALQLDQMRPSERVAVELTQQRQSAVRNLLAAAQGNDDVALVAAWEQALSLGCAADATMLGSRVREARLRVLAGKHPVDSKPPAVLPITWERPAATIGAAAELESAQATAASTKQGVLEAMQAGATDGTVIQELRKARAAGAGGANLPWDLLETEDERLALLAAFRSVLGAGDEACALLWRRLHARFPDSLPADLGERGRATYVQWGRDLRAQEAGQFERRIRAAQHRNAPQLDLQQAIAGHESGLKP